MTYLEFTDKDRQEIFRMLKSHSYMGVKNYLTQLREIKDYSEVINKLKRLIREAGKTNILMKSDVEEILGD
jgi:hypothetical protein